MSIDAKLQDWKTIRELLFKVNSAPRGRERVKIFWEYLYARNAYEMHYHEKFDKLKMPYN